MASKTYHHGDLRTALIEMGIEVISENGVEALSLRKLAKACGVSEAAPYSHFANKKELMSAIENHVTSKLAKALRESVEQTGETPEGLVELGCAFVMFFVHNPPYFKLIYDHLGIEAGGGYEYEPYDFIMGFMQKIFADIYHPQELHGLTFVAQFSFMQGLALFALLVDNYDLKEKEDAVRKILSTNHLLYPNNDKKREND